MKRILNIFVNLYPLWIICSSLLGYLYPPLYQWFSGNWMVGALALVMLGMGLTLHVDDFKEITKMPGAVFMGAMLQYTVLPLSAFGIGKLLQLDPVLAVGLILVGCCPGGTASNVITYLARGHLALSIIMTTVSTLLAIVAIPLLTQTFAGTYMPVDGWGLFLTTVQTVLIPVALGVFINYKFPDVGKKLSLAGPVVSVWAIVFISGSIVAQSADAVAANVYVLIAAAGSLHIIGFIVGYIVSRLFGYDKTIARTASIEIGMQNGGLAAVLARQNFPMQPLAAVPAVFSSVMQTLLGGLLAAYWRWKSDPKRIEQIKTTRRGQPKTSINLIKDHH
ncbi:bile acid:sodium symporter family protein [Sphingobacterium haloxyli]|uniref:Bile acid transporter family protein n=1 Tax=Sphingobacterium haloxyli TaxID=2100533 RepID=A0A2S9J7M4_9SPHI|nr:bile acid:sodium symporter family protein [Sphingobacterium haloxyli]PRD48750.1 bile acid transporter family protein [Sphingobacterium haloxyli]